MSLTIAAACHDVDHPGLNNLYLVESRHPLSIRYNDASVLENHHVATTFEIMTKEENKYNIFDKLDKDQFKKVRKIIIDSILATDMSNHFKKFEVLKACVMQDDFNP
jgi:cAMP-specific phosphodiesterase 4